MSEKLLIPISLLIAGLLVGAGIYFATDNYQAENYSSTKQEETQKNIKKVDPETDHIQGSKDAEIFIVEYSDLECPYCKKYNDQVSSKLIKKYKDNPKVAFVFRHFPLSSIHPSAFGEAVATECAEKLGGQEKFFEYKNKIFEITNSDGNFDNNKLPEIALELGLDKTEFEKCLDNKEVIAKVKSSTDEALAAGIRGTPTIFAQLKSGESFAIPADYQIIDASLSAFLKELDK